MQPLRIAIDGRELEGKPTGMGRYLANLLRSWLDGDGDEQFIVYHRHPLAVTFRESPRVEFRQLPNGLLPLGVYWQQAVLAKALNQEKPDVFFASADALPLRCKVPSLLTIHDLSYAAHPEWFDFTQRMRRNRLARKSTRVANTIIAISEFTRDELIRRFDVPAEKIEVVYHGIDDSFLRAPYLSREELQSRICYDGPYAVMVGSIFERRYTMQVLRAFKMLKDENIGLVIIGDDRRRDKTDLYMDIKNLGVADRVTWLQYCDESSLVGFYRSAEFLIYLSEYEGFGLPPLEGMNLGIPAIVSGSGALKEIYGGSALLVEQETPENIAEAIRKMISGDGTRERLIQAGRELAARLTMKESADKTLNLIRRLGRKK